MGKTHLFTFKIHVFSQIYKIHMQNTSYILIHYFITLLFTRISLSIFVPNLHGKRVSHKFIYM